MKRLIVLLLASLSLVSCTSSIPTPITIPTGPPIPIPMGNYVLGTIVGLVSDYGSGPVTSFGGSMVLIACNQQAVTDATVVFTAPSGAVTLPYLYSMTYLGYSEAEYAALSPTWSYVPGTSYSLSVSDSLGTVSASIPAPGGITWSGLITSTLTATAAYKGNYDSASVQETSPTGSLTYNSNTTNVGSPFNFPGSAFSAAAPATFTASYSASTTQTSFTGSPATGSAFIWSQSYGKVFGK